MSDLSIRLAHHLMRRIIKQEYQVGSTLPKESELCDEYRLSRVVVREAKKRLQTIGMVQPIKRAGSYVLPRHKWNFFSWDLFSLYLEEGGDTIRQLENFYALRLMLEPETAASVAREHSAAFLSDMRELLDHLEHANKTPSSKDLLTADLEFHIRIYAESDNILLLPLANLMRPLFLHGFSYSHTNWENGFIEHLRAFQAIEQGKADEARELAAQLVINGRTRFREEAGRETMPQKPPLPLAL